jgi:hypothetical protein
MGGRAGIVVIVVGSPSEVVKRVVSGGSFALGGGEGGDMLLSEVDMVVIDIIIIEYGDLWGSIEGNFS